MEFNFPAIGIAHTCFTDTFGVPRQPGLAPHAYATIELLPPYNDPAAIEGLELSSHLWLQFVFHLNKRQIWKAKVKPPRLGGNKTLGVFATRSPTRPAPIGLSVVKLEEIICTGSSVQIRVSGVDLVDGTPILDIKPYVPYVDKVEDATNHFADAPPPHINVEFSPAAQANLQAQPQEPHLAALITEVLQQDPRPQYQALDTQRRYGMKLAQWDIQWHYDLRDNRPLIWVDGIVPLLTSPQ